jgi:hypothetical protein
MEKHIKGHPHKHVYQCPSQPAPVKRQLQLTRRELNDFAMKKIVARGRIHDKAMKTPPAWAHGGGGNGGMPESQVLLDMNINVIPDTDSMQGFPAGTRATDLVNYQEIARAFSRCFQPGLFTEMGLAADPYGGFPAGTVYWQHFFNYLRPDGFVVDVGKSGSPTCLGADGVTNGFSYIQIYDCTSEADVFHEIGHLVLDSGVKKRWKPIYYHYAEGGFIPVGGQATEYDAWQDFDRLFKDRNMDNKPLDTDMVHYGFVSDYAEMDEREDFADCFKYYVYYPSVFWDKAARQSAAGFPLLEQKATYMALFFGNLYFADNGIPANWYGFPI